MASTNRYEFGVTWPRGNINVAAEELESAEFEWSFYNNCLVFRALVGSFLPSIRVQTDRILIYTSSQVKLSAVKQSTF